MKSRIHAWKVFKVQLDGTLCSIVTVTNRMCYEVGKQAISRTEDGIFCFDTREHARRFKMNRNEAIYKVEVNEADLSTIYHHRGPPGTIRYMMVNVTSIRG